MIITSGAFSAVNRPPGCGRTIMPRWTVPVVGLTDATWNSGRAGCWPNTPYAAVTRRIAVTAIGRRLRCGEAILDTVQRQETCVNETNGTQALDLTRLPKCVI